MENTWVRTSSVQETRPRVATLLEGPCGHPAPIPEGPERNRRGGAWGGRLRQPSEMASPQSTWGGRTEPGAPSVGLKAPLPLLQGPCPPWLMWWGWGAPGWWGRTGANGLLQPPMGLSRWYLRPGTLFPSYSRKSEESTMQETLDLKEQTKNSIRQQRPRLGAAMRKSRGPSHTAGWDTNAYTHLSVTCWVRPAQAEEVRAHPQPSSPPPWHRDTT